MLKKVDKGLLAKEEAEAKKSNYASEAPAFEPLLPDAIAVSAENAGIKKAKQGLSTQFMLAALGGAFVGLGAMFAMITITGAEGIMSYGLTRLLMGVTFSLGLLLVVIAGAQLFTSDCLMVMAWASGRLDTGRMLRVWTTVWAGIFVGSVALAAIIFLSGHYMAAQGEIGATAISLASYKSQLPVGKAFFAGILCNVLVCLAVWLTLSARSLTDKVFAILFPISAFVAAGFEHCVANMFFIPYGLMIKHGAADAFWATEAGLRVAALDIPIDTFARNMVFVTLGNWVGGALLVGAVYWVIYRRGKAATH